MSLLSPLILFYSCVFSGYCDGLTYALGARVYYYAHILHDWSDEACARILRQVKPAMEPGYSKILLSEAILPDTGCSLLGAGLDIQMMGMHAGMERTMAQWKSLLEGEGFRIVKFWTAPGGIGEGVVEAELEDDKIQSKKIGV